MPAVFAQGSSGKAIRRFQLALTTLQVPKPGGGTEPALAPEQVDGQFGNTMRKAIQRVQKLAGAEQTGILDKKLWETLPGLGAWPSEYEISLGLIGSFEGHDYTKAAGNFDGAGITWGIIGFTLIGWQKVDKKRVPKFNILHKLLKKIDSDDPKFFDLAFGPDQAKILRTRLSGTAADFYKFAQEISTPNGSKLIPAWQMGFKKLGEFGEVQALQESFADTEYYQTALKKAAYFAATYDMASPRTRQLFFDMQVNNGGLGPNESKAAEAALKKLIQDNPQAPLEQKLNAITNVLATSRKKFEKDIRERKGTISNGAGEVHKKKYDLDHWGIERDDKPSPTLKLRLMQLNFSDQIGEQKDLAEAAGILLGSEYAAEMGQDNWPKDNGTSLLPTANGLTLSLKGLFMPADNSLIQPEGDALRQAMRLAFAKPVGVLALFGQSAPEQMPGRGMLFGRQGPASVGLSIGEEGEFSFMRHRLVGETAEASTLEIPEATQNLGNCQLVMLYSGYGVSSVPSVRSLARAWRDRLNGMGANPIVLGWRGNTRPPRDAAGQFVSGRFFAALRAIDPAATLEELCTEQEEQVIQAWGRACWEAFSKGSQRFLWHDPGILSLPFTEAGTAAMGRDGRVWIANKTFDGTLGKPMEAL